MTRMILSAKYAITFEGDAVALFENKAECEQAFKTINDGCYQMVEIEPVELSFRVVAA